MDIVEANPEDCWISFHGPDKLWMEFNMKTGEARWNEDMELPEAAKAAWQAFFDAFPEARKAVLANPQA